MGLGMTGNGAAMPRSASIESALYHRNRSQSSANIDNDDYRPPTAMVRPGNYAFERHCTQQPPLSKLWLRISAKLVARGITTIRGFQVQDLLAACRIQDTSWAMQARLYMV